ncbi:DUF4249 domain-containing protein [Ekhidna sp. To15]|uniref:DUF4249 domain-containing protein n=1 Tax=Ekhidna sp. To15 TaxID=3395267 RepID=UPI003F5252A0
MKKLFILLFAVAILACEDDILVELPEAEPVLAFDAWIYRKAEKQTIRITRTNSYFDSSEPEGISGASVLVVDGSGTVYPFNEESPGTYSWLPANPADSFGTVGETYFLDVQINGKQYGSVSKMGRVPKIDSITWRFEEGIFGSDDSYFAEFWSRDFEGKGDAYWIKSWKNGLRLNKPQEITLSFDGAFSPEGNADGLTFIQPIRDGINPFELDEDDSFIPPFTGPGEDSIYVEINSITPEAWFFWNQVVIQTDRPGGFGELFASSLANVESNIVAEDDEQVVGFFCVSAVSSLGRRFTEDAIREEEE